MGADGTPVVALGHSLGGLHLTAAAAGRDGHTPAAHLVYLTAALADPVELAAMGEQEPWDHIIYEDGVSRADPEKAPALFYHDCDPADVEWAVARLRPSPTNSLDPPPLDYPVAWRELPSTYIVCTDDRMLPPDAQRAMAARAGAQLEIASGHSPFLVKAPELADMLAGIARSVGAGPRDG
jgi:pimeloyl-ACP methyl ester carboxylesterase